MSPKDTSILRQPSTSADVWRIHRWEHPDGRYFELASNVLSAGQIEQRGLPPEAKDYKFHSSTPMVTVEEEEACGLAEADLADIAYELGLERIPGHPSLCDLAKMLRQVDRSARAVDALFGGQPEGWTLDGQAVTTDAATALLSLHDYLNDVTNGLAATGQEVRDDE